MIDFTNVKRRARHWLLSQATISSGGVLSDGTPNWSFEPPVVINTGFNMVLAYVPLGPTVGSPNVTKVLIEEVFAMFFLNMNTSLHNCLTQSGNMTLLSTGNVTLPAATQLLSAVPSGPTTGTISATTTGAVGAVTLASTTGTIVTPAVSTALSVPAAPVALTTALNGTIGGLTMCSNYTISEAKAGAGLYVSEFNSETEQWSLKNPYTQSDISYDWLDLFVDAYSVPTEANVDYCERSYRLRLPEPIIIGPGQALVATFCQRITTQILVVYGRSLIRSLA